MMRPVRFASALLFLSIAVLAPAQAQQFVISTYAGGAPPPTPVAALKASIGSPQSVATDANGNVYFASLNCVFKLDRSGTLTRIAGTSRAGYSGDGGLAINAQLNLPEPYATDGLDFTYPAGLVVDSIGNVYVTDVGNARVRKISPAGIITTVAGGGNSYGDGGPAVSAQLRYPDGLALDTTGNLYISDSEIVRKVSPDGFITTVAATSGELSFPAGLAVDPSGNLYIADVWNHRIRKVSPAGIITTVAGTGARGDSGDGGPAVNAQLYTPVAVAVDGSGNLYIGDLETDSTPQFNNAAAIRKVTPDGIITTVAGGGPCPDPHPCTAFQPWGLAFDSGGNLYIARGGNGLSKISPDGTIARVAGNGSYSYSGDGGPATSAQFDHPRVLAVDNAGNLYISDPADGRVRKVSRAGIVTTVAGNGTSGYSGDGGPATSASVSPEGLAVDSAGNLYIADGSRVRRVSPDGIINTFAGNGTLGYSGDGGPATSAQFNDSSALVMDRGNNLYISDEYRVRRVSRDGIITTVAGTGVQGFSNDGGPATSAELSVNWHVLAMDSSNNLYISDHSRVRRVSPAGIITTVAGGGVQGFDPAFLGYVSGLAIDSSGYLYISDSVYGLVRISPGGIITTVACYGGGDYGYSQSLAIDSAGNIYVADTGRNAVRLLQPLGPVSVSAVQNAASGLTGPVAPGEIVVIWGSGLGPVQLVSSVPGSDGRFGTQLAGTTVQINGTAAPLVYTWATQVAAIVPDSVSGGTAQVAVTYQGQLSASFPVPVAASAPGVFTLDSTGRGQAAAINQDGSINTASAPAQAGEVITLFVTGAGQATSPVTLVGQAVVIPISSDNAVQGVTQLKLRIPSNVQTGNPVPVVVQAGNASSQAGVTIAVH